jgi:hypothetical protein
MVVYLWLWLERIGNVNATLDHLPIEGNVKDVVVMETLPLGDAGLELLTDDCFQFVDAQSMFPRGEGHDQGATQQEQPGVSVFHCIPSTIGIALDTRREYSVQERWTKYQKKNQ